MRPLSTPATLLSLLLFSTSTLARPRHINVRDVQNTPCSKEVKPVLVPEPAPQANVEAEVISAPPRGVYITSRTTVTLRKTITVTPFLMYTILPDEPDVEDTNGPAAVLTAAGTIPLEAPSPDNISPPDAIITSPAAPIIDTPITIPIEIIPQPVPEPVQQPPASPQFLRGVNLGGWLVMEKWMNWEAFTGPFADAADQHEFDSIPGAAEALQKHWSTYYTEADIQTIAATGINALRIPIGFWAYDNTNTPYLKGADAFLERAIGWAKAANMKVWVDLHGSPGGQNGFDNSGRSGVVEWQRPENLARSIEVLKTIATKYGAFEYADTVVGIQLVNEPISWGNNVLGISKTWAKDAYAAVKAAAANPNLVIIMHDAFEGALAWTDVAQELDSNRRFGIDSHMYQLFVESDNTLTQAQHISKACGWANDLSAANSIMPTFVGEWSAATNICVNPDGSTTAGTSCSVTGCQCQSVNFGDWNHGMIEQVRRYVEAQLDVFESSTSGYFIWSAKGPGGWGFLNGIGNGAIPNPVTSRKYPGQCGSKSRRTRRGVLGRT